MKRTADISDFLKPIREKPYQAYLSNALQVADMLDWVLLQLGKPALPSTSTCTFSTPTAKLIDRHKLVPAYSRSIPELQMIIT